ncbi:hypothetical protein D3C72_1584460 [compost metagenome]
MGLGIGHHFLDVLVGQVRAPHDDGRLVGDLRDGREALHRVVRQLVVHHGVAGQDAQRAHEHGGAIGLGARDVVGCQDATGAWLVVDDGLGAAPGQFGGQQPCVLVGAAAGRKGHDDAKGLLGLRRADGEDEAEQKAAEALPGLHGDVS